MTKERRHRRKQALLRRALEDKALSKDIAFAISSFPQGKAQAKAEGKGFSKELRRSQFKGFSWVRKHL